MTGESLPIDKSLVDKVLSGTVNQSGVFTMCAEKRKINRATKNLLLVKVQIFSGRNLRFCSKKNSKMKCTMESGG